jgi:hypothetical protein
MKSLKAAAVVAGSMIVAGVAAPAVAHGAPEGTPTSVTGTVNKFANDSIVRPVQPKPKTSDTEEERFVLSTVEHAADSLDQRGSQLIGGIPVQN